MLFDKNYKDEYKFNNIIEISGKQYDIISLIEDEYQTTKKLVDELLIEVEVERVKDSYGHGTVAICDKNKRVLTHILESIESKKIILDCINKGSLSKSEFFKGLVDQNNKVDEEILKDIMYRNVWSILHSQGREEDEKIKNSKKGKLEK